MRRRRPTPEAERRTAIHEAAHVVASIRKGRSFISVTIEPTEDSRGCVRYRRTPHGVFGEDESFSPARARAIEDSVVASLAGGIGERLAASQEGGRVRRASFQADREHGEWLLTRLNGGSVRQARAHLQLCEVRAEELVSTNWPAILALADVLLSERTMSYERVLQVKLSLPWRPATDPDEGQVA